MPAKYIPYSKFKTNRKNPRSIDPAKLESLMESIKSFPKMMEMNKIVVDENFEILAGRQRFKACVKADIKINARWVDQHKDLTEEQKKEFLVKDNTHAGEWDWKAFAEDDWQEDELEEEKLQQWGVDIPDIAKDVKYKPKKEVAKTEDTNELTGGILLMLNDNAYRLHGYEDTTKLLQNCILYSMRLDPEIKLSKNGKDVTARYRKKLKQ